ncbi:ANL_collapsed_G0003100.mRNA.1.CDS.1 [Saccharomyces cerevisiae]|nr:ANM_HP_G0106870.mRNA.1.CDS.1 [Saccharomyces cerevisiae]CAI4923269.1 AVN_HP_G0136800.mRNA.1.CDS.1 [Saccharomyces cerevisiae]CAI4923915.1 AVN_HP_G0137280.mRNA.1.CDS.1 [Saccharomyces cerevisiae]CAI4930258.1 AVN_HP_G0141880.mRNA.1.CDS.1 [Saccharomyces cerevisiae]CAI4937389.1 AVN_HP_G0146530.mRNA.1.CDS.1 [Saccharomyces cerevisiae]
MPVEEPLATLPSIPDSSADQAPPLIADEFTLDLPRIPSLELPLNVSTKHSSIQKAIKMCGGIEKVKEAFKEHGPIESQHGLQLYLNDDTDSDGSKSYFNEHPVIGKRVPFRDESVILKVTMPKGTLSKNNNSVKDSIKSLKDSNKLRVTPVSIVDNTIKFREMSDFQIKLDNVPSAREFKSSFGSLEWNNFKSFVNSVPDNDSQPQENIGNLILDRSVKIPSTDFQLPPPPKLSMVGFPLLYKYKANPFAKKKKNGVTEVKGTYIKNYQLFVHDLSDKTVIPSQAHEQVLYDFEVAKKTKVYPGTKSDSEFYESLEECLKILRELFARRPIWVKRHLDGIVPKKIHHTMKIALALISYRFTMGPWRNTYIKFGIDPRSSVEYAQYQTEYFKIERKLLSSPIVKKNVPKPPPLVFESDTPGGIDSRFKFDGKRIPWYLMLQIDLLIGEPNIAEVFHNVEYLDKANELTGWFKELDLVKIRRIVKYELGCMVQGNYEYNKYKLKYFKTMLFVKESMVPENKNSEEGMGVNANKDADGDINMDAGSQMSSNAIEEDKGIAAGDDFDDNGAITEEPDDAALENEEMDTDQNLKVPASIDDDVDDVDADEEEQESFDVKTASFQDIINKIAKRDPKTAETMKSELKGFVDEVDL